MKVFRGLFGIKGTKIYFRLVYRDLTNQYETMKKECFLVKKMNDNSQHTTEFLPEQADILCANIHRF